MAKGLYRINTDPPWVQVQYGPNSMPIPEDKYREEGYEPDIDTLPWQGEPPPQEASDADRT
jgi:hypothetical protein